MLSFLTRLSEMFYTLNIRTIPSLPHPMVLSTRTPVGGSYASGFLYSVPDFHSFVMIPIRTPVQINGGGSMNFPVYFVFHLPWTDPVMCLPRNVCL